MLIDTWDNFQAIPGSSERLLTESLLAALSC